MDEVRSVYYGLSNEFMGFSGLRRRGRVIMWKDEGGGVYFYGLGDNLGRMELKMV